MNKISLLILLNYLLATSQIIAGTDTGDGHASRATDTSGGIYNDLAVMIAPQIEPPFDLSEGTEIELSKDKLRPYKSWLESTKLQLTLLLEGNQTLTRQERYNKFRRGVENVLINADRSRNELFTRYILKRAIVIDNTLIEEEENLRIIDVRLSLLEDSISMALSKCESDLVYLDLEPSQQGDLDFIGFAHNYSRFLSTLAKTIIDSSAQYKVYRSLLGFYQWDLYRDSNNKLEVDNIYRINSVLESIPEQVPSDNLNVLQKIREMKSTYQQVKKIVGKAIFKSRIRDFIFVPISKVNNWYKDIEMQIAEVTQEQWVEVMGYNNSFFSKSDYCDDFQEIKGVGMCPLNPVENISFNEIQEFFKKVNSTQTRYEYRLPTIHEWNITAKGDDYNGEKVSKNLGDYAWYSENSLVRGSLQTHKVAQKKKNQYGLYDMLGNVSELTLYQPRHNMAVEFSEFGGNFESRPLTLIQLIGLGPFESADHRNNKLGFRMVRTPR